MASMRNRVHGENEYHIHFRERTIRVYRVYDRDFGRIGLSVELLFGCVRAANDNHYHYFPVNHPRPASQNVHGIVVM